MFVIGDNTYGECGINRQTKLNYLSLNDSLQSQGIKQIAAGDRHTLVLTESGEVFACGDNSDGQCGGEEDRLTVLTKVNYENDEKVTEIVAGQNCSFLVTGQEIKRRRKGLCVGRVE